MMDLRNFSNKRICVAVSGGVDSVTLLYYLKSRERECGYSLSAAQIAEEHKMSENAVWVRLHRTRERLRAYLIERGYKL